MFKRFNSKLLIIALVFLAIRLTGLGTDITNSDAARWHRRTESFGKALVDGNLKETYQSYHPGVTLMWSGSAARFIQEKIFPCTLGDPSCYPIIHQTSKFFLVLFLTLLFILQVETIKRLFNDNTAIIFGFLISIEPYLIGIDRWWHLSSLETYTCFLAVLLLLLWHEEKSIKNLYLASFFLAISILTKVSSIVLIPIFGYVLIKNKNKNVTLKFIGTLILTLLLLLPAIWVIPFQVVEKIIGAIFGAVSDQNRLLYLPQFYKYFYYLIILLFKSSPITLVIFILSILNLAKNKKFEIRILFASLISYLAFYTLSAQKIDRYVVSFIPYILLVCSVYLSKLSSRYLIPVFGTQIAFIIFVILMYFPVYSAYYSPLVGGTKQAINFGIYDNSGEYFLQAANYLNSKKLKPPVYVPNNIESFSYLYKGVTQRTYDESIGYVVESISNERRIFTSILCPDIEKSFGPKGIDVVRIYICK